jgi:hypothetical protein
MRGDAMNPGEKRIVLLALTITCRDKVPEGLYPATAAEVLAKAWIEHAKKALSTTDRKWACDYDFKVLIG